MRRFGYSIGIFLLSQLFLSCDSCGCKRPDSHIASHFDIQGMNVGFVDKTVFNNEYNTDTSLRNFTITKDSAILENDKAALLILFNIKFIAQNKFNFSLVNSAYACSPNKPGDAGSKEAIDSFYIIPIDRILALDTSIYKIDTFFVLNNHISTLPVKRNDTIVPFSASNNGGIGTNGSIDFISNTKIYFNFRFSLFNVTSLNYVRFRVVLKLKNGERYEQLTNHIKIIN